MQVTLHSTMFLLIRKQIVLFERRSVFTFHNVSINTHGERSRLTVEKSLHSTMFLLIQISA